MKECCGVPQAACGITVAIVSFIIFIALLTGITLPDIKIRHNFRRTECTILTSIVDRAYNPSYRCSGCANYDNTPSCGSVISAIRNRDPDQCPADPSQCASTQACNTGFYCCQERRVCAQCTTCVQKCDAKGKNCHQVCTTRDCNCYYVCLQSVPYRGCLTYIDYYYTPKVSLRFADTQGANHTTQYVFDRLGDPSAATNTMSQYSVGESFSCWYDATDNLSIRWDIAFNYPALVFMYIFGVLAMIGALIALDDVCSDSSKDELLLLIWSEIFFGLFLPLVVLLPSALGDLQPTVHVKQALLFCTFFFVFMTPGTFAMLRAADAALAGAVYYMLIGIPFGVAMPCFQFHENPAGFAKGVVIYSAIAAIIMVGVRLSLTRLSWNRAVTPAVVPVTEPATVVIVNTINEDDHLDVDNIETQRTFTQSVG